MDLLSIREKVPSDSLMLWGPFTRFHREKKTYPPDLRQVQGSHPTSGGNGKRSNECVAPLETSQKASTECVAEQKISYLDRNNIIKETFGRKRASYCCHDKGLFGDASLKLSICVVGTSIDGIHAWQLPQAVEILLVAPHPTATSSRIDGYAYCAIGCFSNASLPLWLMLAIMRVPGRRQRSHAIPSIPSPHPRLMPSPSSAAFSSTPIASGGGEGVFGAV